MQTVRILRALLAICGATLLFVSRHAKAWWDEAWSSRMKIGLDTAGISAPLTQVPVVVRLHAGNFPFSACNADGSDLRFVGADDKTTLPFHIDRFDATYGIAVVWVQIPSTGGAAEAGHFWMYYGNPEAAPAQERAATYDRNHRLVLHFNESETFRPTVWASRVRRARPG